MRSPSLEIISRSLLPLIGFWLVAGACFHRPHRHTGKEGLLVGLSAGLIPCPLTLFTDVMAAAHGVPGAGLAFALAMMQGVTTTLSAVPLTVFAQGRRRSFGSQIAEVSASRNPSSEAVQRSRLSAQTKVV